VEKQRWRVRCWRWMAMRWKKVLDGGVDYYHNVAIIMLGEFEYLLITAAAGLGDDAYGAAVREEIQTATGRKCSLGALYTTIDRLETKGFLKTWMGNATAQRGGRAKRMIRVTPKGVLAAKEFYDAVVRVSRGAAWAENQAGGSS
jgi:PadR family transcriptional regulator, regulatory protein PadR